jgi:hypothetical protein
MNENNEPDERLSHLCFKEWSRQKMEKLVAVQMSGKYTRIPDEFMGRLALLLKLDWEFDVSDEDYEKAIVDEENRIELNKQYEADFEALVNGSSRKLSKDEKNLIEGNKERIDRIILHCTSMIEEYKKAINLRESLRNRI